MNTRILILSFLFLAQSWVVAEKPNIVVILCDDLGDYDRVGANVRFFDPWIPVRRNRLFLEVWISGCVVCSSTIPGQSQY